MSEPPMSLAGQAHAPSGYADSVPDAPLRAPPRGDHATDVCVLGAGYTGLSAALSLAERGYRVTVLEAHRVG
ncbi:FAD-dependent oxidoreductase, partial [Stenotrophomonas sp. SrG]|uniref:FAD-dependent oxidoreductase n=1 Tax=Stenotrophomonas sp. SrG TaxID=3414430 RepID=UPI003CF14B22